MDELVTPLVKKRQSIHHIYVTQANNILCSERTIYKLIEQGVLSVRNIDLPRKVRYRPRRHDTPFKVDKNCRIGRTYQDFKAYVDEHPDTPIVQMDSVEGCKGGKVLLTIFFTQSDLMLMYLRNRNTSQSVIDIFNNIDEILGREVFIRLFPVILTDNGSEFSNPRAIEYDTSGLQRTRIFYCDPSSPHQKPEIEREHEFIRMVLPKGKSFDHLTQSDVDILACHINSLIRKKLNDRPPTATFSFFHGDLVLHKLGLQTVPPENVTLTPTLLGTSKEVSKLEKDL
jgi:IS30 family transposase